MARIAFLLPDLSGGGAERVALTLIEALIGRGHEVDLVLCQKRGPLLSMIPAGVRIVDLGAKRMRHVLPPLVRYLRSARPQALQASMWPITVIAIAAGWVARSGTRVVVSEHSAISQAYAEKGRLHRVALSTSIRRLFPRAAGRVAVSQGVRDELASMGVDRQSIEVILNPIAPVVLSGSERYDWPGVGRRILSVGNLVPAKNQALLLRAFALVAKEVETSLVICGEGELRTDLEVLAHQLGVGDKVFLPGFVTALAPVYAAADLFVLSSDREGYGLVLVEAMRAGLPVVATDCAHGPAEVLGGGEFGTLVPTGAVRPLADAILAALADPADPHASKARAAELADGASIDRYEELLLGQSQDGGR